MCEQVAMNFSVFCQLKITVRTSCLFKMSRALLAVVAVPIDMSSFHILIRAAEAAFTRTTYRIVQFTVIMYRTSFYAVS